MAEPTHLSRNCYGKSARLRLLRWAGRESDWKDRQGLPSGSFIQRLPCCWLIRHRWEHTAWRYFKPSASRAFVKDKEGKRNAAGPRRFPRDTARRALPFLPLSLPGASTSHHPFCRSPLSGPVKLTEPLSAGTGRNPCVNRHPGGAAVPLPSQQDALPKCPRGPSLRAEASLDAELLLQGRNPSYSPEGPQQPARPPIYIFVE